MASAVPATRARIFLKATSRAVSSAKGEKPQSSVVPKRSGPMDQAASRTRSRTSSAVSMRASMESVTPTNGRARRIAWISSVGRGMPPMGSVGMAVGQR